MTPEARWQALRDYLTTAIVAAADDAEAWKGHRIGTTFESRAENLRSVLAKMTELEGQQ